VGNLWVVETGLAPTDRVVVEGAQRVRPGTVVSPKPAAATQAGAGTKSPAAAGEGH
jgi:hypothetical protein